MRNRRILKIGLSLMIALMFLLPTGAVLADDERDADNLRDIGTPRHTTEKYVPEILGTRDMATSPVVEQATTTSVLNMYLETCTGDTMYKVESGAVIPLEDCYEPMYQLETLDDGSVYEPEIEIYKMNADQDFCLYQTSFEDNARNYMEWGQMDLDCTAVGGYYDGWAWSDARACGSDHSFKCTMYDEYKNMQHDRLYMKDLIDLTVDEFELCDGSTVEIDTVGNIKVQFDIYVDGERNAEDWDYSNPYPLDYLQFGIIDGEGNFDYVEGGPNLFLTSTPMGSPGWYIDHDVDGPDSAIFWSTQIGLVDLAVGAYDYTSFVEKIDGCPGWWHVEWNLAKGSLMNPDEFGVFFDWRSDKERVFEGAYVDNVEIDVTEDIGEKIYQGHSQDWLTQEEAGTHWFKFPLDWDDDIEVTIDIDDDEDSDTYGDDLDDSYYLAHVKIKADDGTYNHWQEIQFEIGTVDDCTVEITGVEDDFSHEPIPDGGIMQYPSDAHIEFCYKNNGNEPVSDTEITATAYKSVRGEEAILFEDDFEGMFNWVTFYDEHPVHVSDKFAFSGSKSLAFNQPENDMIVGGTQGGVPISTVRYGAYSNDFFSMEDVGDAVLDFYWKGVIPDGAEFMAYIVGYWYLLGAGTILDGATCQKTWIGPMQPQGQYVNIDIGYWFDYWSNEIPNSYDFNFFNDENGHMTYETTIGFELDTTNVEKEEFVPECCFEPGETPWSGVYVDDVSVRALSLKGDAVWSDSMVIPGPCEPGEKCCDQFTWEDVPYSNYIIEVGTDCDVDDWEIIVLEDLEQASKVEGVDYTECEPTAWCISDVVGNDCGGEDHYALATNCDTNTIPEGVEDYIALEHIDISHIDLVPPEEPDMFCQEIIGDVETDGHGAFSSDYYPYRVYDNFDLGSSTDVDTFSFYGLEAYGDDTFDGNYFNIGFYQDAGGSPGAEILDQEWLCSAADQTFVQTWLGYSIWLIEGELPTPVTVTSGWFSVQSAQYAHGNYADLAWIDGVGDGVAYQDATVLDYDMAFCIGSSDSGGGGGPGGCSIVLDEGFEDGVMPPTGWTTTGWALDLYGAACEGSHWAYSWAAGDELTSPPTYLGDDSATLTFQKAAEGSTHPMDLELYVDGIFVDGWYGYTHTDCETVTVDLSAFSDGGDHTITFLGNTSDFYGQILDDIVVEACDAGSGPEPEEGDSIWFNMTYQMDMRDTMGEVILEVAGYEEGEDGWCDGCEEPYSCPAGIEAWEQVESYSGNAPGVCQNTSVDLAPFLGANDTHMCVRLRLSTVDPGSGWNIPGIGFHVHELSISDILYDEFTEESSDFVEDFEDANFVNEDSGLTWNIDCVTFGEHVMECDDFKFCIADECPYTEPYEPSSNEFTLYGEDSWGDGWDSDYDYMVDAFVDVYVNGALVVDDFTVTGSSDSATFTAEPGDEITAEYTTANGIFESEHDWWIEDADGNVWITYALGSQTVELPTEISFMEGRFPAEPIDEAIIWETEIEDAYEAYLTANWVYDLPAGAELTFEISADGGDNWYIIAHEEGAKSIMESPVPSTPFDLTPWAGNRLLIRVHLENHGVDTDSDGTPDTWYDGYVCVDHVAIQGKQDLFPPTASISLSGNNVGPGMYAGPVTVTITAKDDMAMGEIHYILDGTESVVSGNKATFTVSEDGDHTIEYWAVDATGNEGAHSSVSFSIDNSPPTVSLTAPEPGLYLFGSKLLSMNKPFIIGAFTAAATAEDAQGVAVVKFLLNGEVVGEDTEAPYDVYVAQKNMGGATLEAVAEDGVGNTASDSMDITYYKFL